MESPTGWLQTSHDREEALKSWTVEGAYAAFEETRFLTPGSGDFVVLSRDIMRVPAKEILSTGSG